MPPELMELYMLYQQELQTRQSEKEANYLSELNTMLRVGYLINQYLCSIYFQSPSMLSLRGPEFEEKPSRDDRLPPIYQEPEPEMLFQSRTDLQQARAEQDYMRAESRLSLTSPERLVVSLPQSREISCLFT